MSVNNPESEKATYVEALIRIEAEVWEKCREIAIDLNLSTNEILALGITELHSRLMNIRQNRLLISVDASDAAFYASSLEMHLSEADPVYAQVLRQLSEGPLEVRRP